MKAVRDTAHRLRAGRPADAGNASIQIVTVVNDKAMYKRTIADNPFMDTFDRHVYDNTKKNIGIPSRYNGFIRRNMTDGWVIFCHQDFGFRAPIQDRLAALDHGCVYGPIVVGPSRQFALFAAISGYGIESTCAGMVTRARKFGRILSGEGKTAHIVGKRIRKPVVVDTVDCCCMIVHSSLVRRCSLSFDEKLPWHMYVEDFCLNAKHAHGIVTKALPLDAVHVSSGSLDLSLQRALLYVKEKYRTESFATTCYDGYKRF